MAVHDAGNQGFVAQARQGGWGRNGALEDVDVQGVDVGGGEGAELGVERAVRGGDEDLRAACRSGKDLIGAGNGCFDFGGRGVLVNHKCRLVELDPAGSGGGELLEELDVDGQDVLEAGQRGEAGGGVVGGLGEQQVGDRANEVGAGLDAVGQGEGELVDLGGGREGELGLRADFRHQVVVVGVEPLGHFQRLLFLVAAGQREVAVDVELSLRVEELAEAGRYCAEVRGGVQDLVVVGEGARHGSGFGQAELLQALGDGELDVPRGCVQCGGVDLAGPVGLDGLLKLAPAADAGVAQE
ncbi:hypothetical protein RKD54_001638 [Pseudarthrobacter sp. SLBN-100]